MTYKETRPWAKAIREAVVSRRMPPWHADPAVGKFRNDLSLTELEIKTIAAWADGGAAEGNIADAPKPREFAQGWRMPKPDVVFEMPEQFHVPASGVLDYQYFMVPTNFTEDRWVEIAEVRPAARPVVHHAIVMVRSPAERGWYGGQFLAGYAPGAVPQVWMPGQARLIPAGASLIFQMHYTSNGKPATDRTQIGLIFAKQPPKQRILAVRASNAWLAIPPGAPDYRVEASVTMYHPVTLAGIRPHMHMRGKSFEVRVVFPNGESRLVLRVPRYDFHWQPYYYFSEPLALPAGTRLECYARYDNSANNPLNPDPMAEVHWGEQSWDEMMIGWFDVAVDLKSADRGRLSDGGI